MYERQCTKEWPKWTQSLYNSTNNCMAVVVDGTLALNSRRLMPLMTESSMMNVSMFVSKDARECSVASTYSQNYNLSEGLQASMTAQSTADLLSMAIFR